MSSRLNILECHDMKWCRPASMIPVDWKLKKKPMRNNLPFQCTFIPQGTHLHVGFVFFFILFTWFLFLIKWYPSMNRSTRSSRNSNKAMTERPSQKPNTPPISASNDQTWWKKGRQHDDVIRLKRVLHYWSFLRKIHWYPVNSRCDSRKISVFRGE